MLIAHLFIIIIVVVIVISLFIVCFYTINVKNPKSIKQELKQKSSHGHCYNYTDQVGIYASSLLANDVITDSRLVADSSF